MRGGLPHGCLEGGAKPMLKVLRSYLFWTYTRGSFHYDVMVTLILLFLFVSPHVINFKDRPQETVAFHASEVLVREAGSRDGNSRFMYQVRAEDMGHAASDAERRAALLRVIAPISGEVTLERYEEVKDAAGKVIAYDAWVVRS